MAFGQNEPCVERALRGIAGDDRRPAPPSAVAAAKESSRKSPSEFSSWWQLRQADSIIGLISLSKSTAALVNAARTSAVAIAKLKIKRRRRVLELMEEGRRGF